MATNPAAFTSLTGPALLGEPPWIPADANMLAWTYDPAIPSTATTALPTAGVLNLFRVNVRAPVTVANIVTDVGTAGVTLTAGQCFAGLYSSAGTLIGTTADQAANWAAAAYYTQALTGGPFAIPAGFYWIAMLFNGTTGPAFMRQNNVNTSFANNGLGPSSARYATNGAANTSLPASITPASNTLAQVNYWAAIS